MSVAAGVSDAAIAVRDKLRGWFGQTKVKRYWPGPREAPRVDREPGGDDLNLPACRAALHHVLPRHDDGIGVGVGVSGDDRRLRRLTETRAENREEARVDNRRVIRQAEVASTAEERYGEDEEAQEERRRQIRERLLLLEREEEELLAQEEELVAAEISEDESEYGTDSGDEGMFITLVKLIFIQKTQRVTTVKRKRMEEVARQLEELLKKRMKECKIETRRIVVQEIRKELRINKIQSEESDIEIEVLTDDEENKAEYEAWTDREIKRDREEREVRLREREEIQKVSNMTEEERSEWEWMNPKLLKQPKQKRRFMQKYYHKAFLLPGES